MSPRGTPDYHRGYGLWSGIAGALFLVVAIFGKHGWDLSRIMCLVAGVFNLALSAQQFRKAKSTEGSPPSRT